jgi:hypothetical protein
MDQNDTAFTNLPATFRAAPFGDALNRGMLERAGINPLMAWPPLVLTPMPLLPISPEPYTKFPALSYETTNPVFAPSTTHLAYRLSALLSGGRNGWKNCFTMRICGPFSLPAMVRSKFMS